MAEIRIKQSDAFANAPLPRQDLMADGLPGLGAVFAVFLLYTNAMVVAVHFHGAPGFSPFFVPGLLAVPVGLAFLRGEKIWITPSLLLAFAFVMVQFLGCLYAKNPVEAMEGLETTVTEGLILYILVCNAFRSETSIRRAIWALLAAGVFMGLVVGYQQLTKSYDNNMAGFGQLGSAMERSMEGEVTQSRLAGPIGEVNRFGQIMAMLIPLGFLALGAVKDWKARALILASIALSGIGSALAFSRGVAVGLGMTVVAMVGVGVVKIRHLAALGAVLGLALIAVPQYAERVASMADLTKIVSGSGVRNADGAVRGRVTEMLAAGLLFADNPIIGVGPNMAKAHYKEYAQIVGGKVRAHARRAHNLYLAIAAEHGMLGLIAFLGVVVATWIDLQRTRKRCEVARPDLAALATGLQMAIVAYLATSMFLHPAYIRYYWLFMGLAGAAGRVLHTRSPGEGQVFAGYATAAASEEA